MATCSSDTSTSSKLLAPDPDPMCWIACAKGPGTSYEGEYPATVHLPDGEEIFARRQQKSSHIIRIPSGEERRPVVSRSLPLAGGGGGRELDSPSQQPPPPWPSPIPNHGSCVLPPPNRCASELLSNSDDDKRPGPPKKRSAASPLASFRNLGRYSNTTPSTPHKLLPPLDAAQPDSNHVNGT